ncbi:MAG: LysR family transcriptional regulator [Pseudohongiellaceae bacterium]|nr:LysR family transcriptional regulator [Pseudohongiellaceae bacterium]
MLERHHLAILREIDRQGSLTAAAKSLFLTQSALTHAIKKLEQHLGVVLWRKEGRRLRLTPAGLQLLALSHRVLPQFEHAEQRLQEMAKGQRGSLRIGMECHPCYQWLVKIVEPYLHEWPKIDVDVKQEFTFGGMAALFAYDIDILVTPDPLLKPGIVFQPVFDFEQVLVVAKSHPLAKRDYVTPEQLVDDVLITYPVSVERLDIFSQFFMPAQCSPKVHKTMETTDMILQMVAAGRGVTALPGWLVAEYSAHLPIKALRLNPEGVAKQIFLGVREADQDLDYLSGFLSLALGQ